MKKITVDEIMALNPCCKYSREVVAELWAGRESLDADEIAALEIPVADRLWAVLRACLGDRARRIFACDCADRALASEMAAGRTPDPRSVDAVAVARRFAMGEATRGELRAAYVAAYAAASAASAYAAAYVAAYAAAYAAYSADADAASSAEKNERFWQLARAVELARGET